eukprot:3667118-Amphidinium_carterae.1
MRSLSSRRGAFGSQGHMRPDVIVHSWMLRLVVHFQSAHACHRHSKSGGHSGLDKQGSACGRVPFLAAFAYRALLCECVATCCDTVAKMGGLQRVASGSSQFPNGWQL